MAELRAHTRAGTLAGELARSGFTNSDKSAALLSAAPLSEIVEPESLSAFAQSADPDTAALVLSRILEGRHAQPLKNHLARQPESLAALVRILGVSEAFGDFLVLHPDTWVELWQTPLSLERSEMLRQMVVSVGADPAERYPTADGHDQEALVHLRVAYRSHLLQIAINDLIAEHPVDVISDNLTHAADAVLEAATAIARSEVGEASQLCDLAIIAMGKTGGEELNYISDVDVIFVVESPTGNDDEAIRIGAKLASSLMGVCSSSTPEGEIWEVDAALRPEGKAGALVRTLDSHIGYYERWAQTWEFQALLKARACAGDSDLGHRYIEAAKGFVWEAAGRDQFVEDVQSMRRRVESTLKGKHRDRDIKLAPGGLRDVEFSVQLLQLVHGRSDFRLRNATTLSALDALSSYGYIGRKDAADMASAYRFLRTLEHRVQLHKLKRTHQLPADEGDLRRIGRSLGMFRDSAKELEKQWQTHARDARRLHEKLFYRPLLQAVARLDTGEARLSLEAAGDRLRVLGFTDPDSALNHLKELTAGVSRRAAIQRTLLPVMLGWFAHSPDPDAGLLGFRKVSDELGSTHWYLRLLRDESIVAQRLATILGSSKYAADLVLKVPEAVAMLQQSESLKPRDRLSLEREMLALVDRNTDPETGVGAVRNLRRRELFRLASGDVLHKSSTEEIAPGLSALVSATIAGALHAAFHAVTGRDESARRIKFLVMAMGRLGGAELGYASDADVMFAYEPLGNLSSEAAAKQALAIANEIRRLLMMHSPHPALEVDATLRPEGRTGPPVRSVASYRAYYEKWSSPWEAQALLRAVPACGDEDMGRRFIEMIEPLRYPEGGLDANQLLEMQRLKARMEAERLPRGADPKMHTKLGPGGLSDVEWTVQQIQLQHAYQHPALRVSQTLPALEAANQAGLLDSEDAEILKEAWLMATKVRNATMLATGKTESMVPITPPTVGTVAALTGYGQTEGQTMIEDYRRATRRCRRVVERVFYGQ